jgi:ribonuclease PH
MLFALTSMDALAVMHFSCLFEMGNTRVIDAAYGPREVDSPTLIGVVLYTCVIRHGQQPI